ncbi:hypothetical protein TWF173_009417 [Orbilia oligospora]|nr:hypothetical protein TWF173_009417 [Orbilia oligospora]
MSTITTGDLEPPEPGLAGPSVTAARRPVKRRRSRKELERERMEEEDELEKRKKARLEREQVEYLLQRVKRLEKEVEYRDRQLAHQSQVIRGLQRSAVILSQNPGSAPGPSSGPHAGTFFSFGLNSASRPERIPRPRSRSRSSRSLSPNSTRHSSPHTPRRHSSLGPDSDTDHPAAATAG